MYSLIYTQSKANCRFRHFQFCIVKFILIYIHIIGTQDLINYFEKGIWFLKCKINN